MEKNETKETCVSICVIKKNESGITKIEIEKLIYNFFNELTDGHKEADKNITTKYDYLNKWYNMEILSIRLNKGDKKSLLKHKI